MNENHALAGSVDVDADHLSAFDVADLPLHISSNTIAPGMTLTFTSPCAEPPAPILLAFVTVDRLPVFSPLALGQHEHRGLEARDGGFFPLASNARNTTHGLPRSMNCVCSSSSASLRRYDDLGCDA